MTRITTISFLSFIGLLITASPASAQRVASVEALVAAVAEAKSGAVIELAEGTYRLAQPLDLKGSIELKGAGIENTIITSAEFFATETYRSKVKSPFELVVSSLRVMNAAADATPRTTQLVSRLGQPIFGHQAPNGYPETGDAWMNTGSILNRINFGLAVASGRVPGVRLVDWPAAKSLATLSREQQVDGVIRELLGGAASNDTRQVLLTGTNPFLEARDKGTTLTQDIATLPPAQGLAQIVGLALGAPEFQRR